MEGHVYLTLCGIQIKSATNILKAYWDSKWRDYKKFPVTFQEKTQNFSKFPSHQILWHMHETLNIDKKQLIAQFAYNLRDESFKPN